MPNYLQQPIPNEQKASFTELLFQSHAGFDRLSLIDTARKILEQMAAKDLYEPAGAVPTMPSADVASSAVLKNNVVIGSVNANKPHWYKAAEALARADRAWLSRIITGRECPENFAKALSRGPQQIKVVIQFIDALSQSSPA